MTKNLNDLSKEELVFELEGISNNFILVRPEKLKKEYIKKSIIQDKIKELEKELKTLQDPLYKGIVKNRIDELKSLLGDKSSTPEFKGDNYGM